MAVVGRAGSLLRSQNGPAIDDHDVVIRVNWVLPIPAEQVPHTGQRTDFLIHCKRAQASKRSAVELGIPTYRIRGKDRRRAAERHFDNSSALRPTTGMMAILKSYGWGAASVSAFGFDFFRSGHVQDREPDGDDYSKPLAWAHSPEEERKAFQRLAKKFKGRFIPDAILKEALR